MSDSKASYTPLSQSDELAPPPAYDASAPKAGNHSQQDEGNLIRQVFDRTERLVMLQPSGTQQMSLGGARNSKGVQVGLDGKRNWNHGLLECHQAPALTAAACFCSPCVYQANHKRRTHLEQTGEPLEGSTCGKALGLHCFLYAIGPQLAGVGNVILQCFARTQTRQRYALRGSCAEDLAVSTFCTICGLVQEAREIGDEEDVLRQEGNIQLVEDDDEHLAQRV